MQENERMLHAKHARLLMILERELSEKRLDHSIAVAQRAYELAGLFHADKEMLWTAGIAHDLCRERGDANLCSLAEKSGFPVEEYEKETPILLHGKAAVAYLRGVYPISELAYFAIAHHTLGHANPTVALKMLYIADASSLDRDIDFRDDLKDQSLDRQCCITIEDLEKRYALHSQTKSMYLACGEKKTSNSFEN